MIKTAKRKYKARTRWSHQEDAKKMIGDLNSGDLFFGITCGNISKVDLIEHCIDQVEGKVDLLIVTWTVADYDMSKIKSLIESEKIGGLKMIVDRSFVSRQRAFAEDLTRAFGPSVLKYQRIHAKMFCVIGENKQITCFTSMNLNENKRFENFVINVDNEVTQKAINFFNVVFSKSPSSVKSGYKFLSEDYSTGTDDEKSFTIETDDSDFLDKDFNLNIDF